MKWNFAFFAILASLLFYSSSSSAQLLDLEVLDYGLAPTDPAYATFKSLIDTEIATIEADLNKDLPSAPPERLMEGMANSSVMAGKGIGTDYASNMDVFLIGAGVGAGVDLAKDKETKSDISGAGIAPGVVFGVNLGFLDTARFMGMDTNRLNFYVNFMDYTLKRTINDKPGKRQEAELGMTSIGTHFRYDWVKKRGSRWLGWGGVKFHFGYEYNKTDINFRGQIDENVNSTGGGGAYTVSGNVQGNPEAQINVATHSIPLALSTDIQLLYFLSLYGGLGADLNFGQAKGKGNLNASPSTVSCSGGAGCAAAGNPDATIQANANVNATGKVNPFTTRGFAGVQFNLPFIRIFGQVDKSFGNDLIGATAGVRFVY